jgi:hypothetical protein
MGKPLMFVSVEQMWKAVFADFLCFKISNHEGLVVKISALLHKLDLTYVSSRQYTVKLATQLFGGEDWVF